MQLRFTLTAAAILCALASPARAEIIQLLDNTQLNGKIVHFYDGTFAIETSDGQKVELPTSKIKSISFKLPPARAEFNSPEKTFARYRDALLKNDVPKLVECYALMYQGMVANDMSHISDEDKKKVQADLAGTKLEVKSSKISGNSAVLKVQRTRGSESQTDDVRMVLENGEWKLTP